MMNFTDLGRFLLRFTAEMRLSRTMIWTTALAGAVSGLANAALLVVINSHLNGEELPFVGSRGLESLAWAFVGLCLALPLFRFLAQDLLNRLTQEAFRELRIELCRRILAAPLGPLEEVGEHRLTASLTDDVGQVTGALATIPQLIMHSAIVAGCLAYLGFLSPVLFLELLGFMVVGVLSYQIPILLSVRYFERSRRHTDQLFLYFRWLIEGTKELKMHRGRRVGFLGRARETAGQVHREVRVGTTIFSAASSWGQALFFVFLGLLFFVLPRYHELTQPVLVGYSLTLLYMMGSLEAVLTWLPELGRASVAVRRIDSVSYQLVDATTERVAFQEPGSEPAIKALPAGEPAADSRWPVAFGRSWSKLKLAEVAYAYRRDDETESFPLGPVSLTFEPGELVFLVGGNGSGKTTMAKLLIGLYAPLSGEIRLDGVAVDDSNRDAYRQMFSVVFSDFFVFEELLGFEGSDLDRSAREYLVKLHLEKKVRVEDGRLSTVNLSQGQRKRLALMSAYLEDRPFYLFDEWAADQDPEFKQVFYMGILPELKKRGKTVIAITHDDAYFHLADRIVKLDYGQLVADCPAWQFSTAGLVSTDPSAATNAAG